MSVGWDWHSPQLQKGARAKCSTAAFCKMFACRKWGSQVPLSHNYNVAPENVVLLPCLLLCIINSLEVVQAVVCLHQSAQPT
jgi:hypothetical protein